MKCSKGCGTSIEAVRTTLGKIKLVEATYVSLEEGKGPTIGITDAGRVVRGRRSAEGATKVRLEHACGGAG